MGVFPIHVVSPAHDGTKKAQSKDRLKLAVPVPRSGWLGTSCKASSKTIKRVTVVSSPKPETKRLLNLSRRTPRAEAEKARMMAAATTMVVMLRGFPPSAERALQRTQQTEITKPSSAAREKLRRVAREAIKKPSR